MSFGVIRLGPLCTVHNWKQSSTQHWSTKQWRWILLYSLFSSRCSFVTLVSLWVFFPLYPLNFFSCSRCKARGDPEPVIHWISPEGKLVSNSSRTLVYNNGTLDILISTVKDTGSFTCISSNPAGEAHHTVDLVITKLPHISNNTNSIQEPDPGSSDISTSTRGGANGSNVTADVKGGGDKRVVTAEATSSTALIKFNFQRNIPGIRMFQIQYNGSQDDSLVYRLDFFTLDSVLQIFFLSFFYFFCLDWLKT